MPQKIPQTCQISIFYNIHNRNTLYKYVISNLDKFKQERYQALAIEKAHNEGFSDAEKALALIKNLPFKITPQYMDSMFQGMDNRGLSALNNHSKDKLMAKITQLKNIASPDLALAISVINDRYKSIIEPITIQVGSKKIHYPIKIKDLQSLSTKEKKTAVKEIKERALEVLKATDHDSYILYRTIIEAMLKGFKPYGMDAEFSKDCNSKDLECRDQFMSNKLVEYCERGKGNILAIVGLSHIKMGHILRKKMIQLKEYYPIDSREVSYPLHHEIILGMHPNIKVIDTELLGVNKDEL